ncbi:MAG: FHA domain-containing protein [Anaerolineaceae bacterium]|nr:FHA domain-containing protein [Anaerolineaceae bacterium]
MNIGDQGNIILIIAVICVGLLFLMICLGLVIFFFLRKRKSSQGEVGGEEVITPIVMQPVSQPEPVDPGIDATLDHIVISEDLPAMPQEPVAVLQVLDSEDKMMIGQRINITKVRTTVGRGADNDIILPKDKAVSRYHAILEQMNQEVFITEKVIQEENGNIRRPTYGTFINGEKLSGVPIQLNHNDSVQLGTRFTFSFQKTNPPEEISPGEILQNEEDAYNADDQTLIM